MGSLLFSPGKHFVSTPHVFIMVKIKAKDLRAKNDADLRVELKNAKAKLQELRVEKVANGNATKLSEIKPTLRNVARILTILNQRRKTAMRKKYTQAKYKPLDLRPKLTRELRRVACQSTLRAETKRATIKRQNFPQRKFAVKA